VSGGSLERLHAERVLAGLSRRLGRGPGGAAYGGWLDADRMYINTGKWSDLIPWRRLARTRKAKVFIDKLGANRCRRSTT